MVDSHSKWLEVIPMKTTTSEKTIDELCEEIVSDNGLQFMSHVFKSFCEANGVKHIRVVPYHPQLTLLVIYWSYCYKNDKTLLELHI